MAIHILVIMMKMINFILSLNINVFYQILKKIAIIDQLYS